MEFGGVGVGGTGTGGASFVGAGAKGHDTRDTSSEGVGVEGVGARGASSEGAGAEEASSAGARGVGVAGAGEVGAGAIEARAAVAGGAAAAATFAAVASTSSTSTPITNYYHATCHVVTRVLASVVTNPRASPSSISALTATVSEYAATRHLVYATPVVAAHPLSTGGTYVNAIPPPGANVVDDMWLLKVKRPPGSSPVFKSRYMARGFSPRDRVDFFQNFAPTPKMTTLQVLLHVAAQRDYKLLFLNFSAAFLQGHLHEEIGL
ncbi:unnamed protein product [Closterium sp. NIES-53]